MDIQLIHYMLYRRTAYLVLFSAYISCISKPYLPHFSLVPDRQLGAFIHLTGWGWGSCTPVAGRVGGVIYFLQHHLRIEVSCPQLCACKTPACSFEMEALIIPHLEIRVTECSWSSFIFHHMLKWKLGPLHTWLTHYRQDHAKNWHWVQSGSLPNLFQLIWSNCSQGLIISN